MLLRKGSPPPPLPSLDKTTPFIQLMHQLSLSVSQCLAWITTRLMDQAVPSMKNRIIIIIPVPQTISIQSYFCSQDAQERDCSRTRKSAPPTGSPHSERIHDRRKKIHLRAKRNFHSHP
ncbi:hypothetical protein V6Z88_007639 [Aspergillus fumigatus]